MDTINANAIAEYIRINTKGIGSLLMEKIERTLNELQVELEEKRIDKLFDAELELVLKD